MLAVTEAAAAQLALRLDQQGVSEEVAVRFVYQEQTIAVRPDGKRVGDTTFQHAGRTVLRLDAHVSEMLAPDTLDFRHEKLTRPRPK